MKITILLLTVLLSSCSIENKDLNKEYQEYLVQCNDALVSYYSVKRENISFEKNLCK